MDINSVEFQEELKKTIKFTDGVVEKFGFAYNPNLEITQSVQLGLTRNKLLHGKRFCPCFFVTGTSEDRQCPCKIAIDEEIPTDGHCHCGIFCTKQTADQMKLDMRVQEDAHSHKNILTEKECLHLLSKDDVDGDELEALLEARIAGIIDFILIDVRETYENKSKKIVGTNELLPTSTFFNDIQKYEKYKDKHIILYCRSGSRTYQVKTILKNDFKFSKVSHLTHGIVSYSGELN